MTDYELQSLSALTDLVLYIRVIIIIIGILISAYGAQWFARTIVFKYVRSFIKFRI